MTSRRQISLFTEDELTSCQAAFLVKTQASQSNTEEGSEDCAETGQGSGARCSELSVRLHPSMSLPKTSQTSCAPMRETIGESSWEGFPDWGTMQNGELAELQRSVRPITEPEFSWLLTPVASEFRRLNLSSPFWRKRYHRGVGSVSEQLHRLGYRGKVSQRFFRWMMGFPENWTASPFQSGETNQSKPTGTP